MKWLVPTPKKNYFIVLIIFVPLEVIFFKAVFIFYSKFMPVPIHPTLEVIFFPVSFSIRLIHLRSLSHSVYAIFFCQGMHLI